MLIYQPKWTIDVVPCIVFQTNRSLVGILHVLRHSVLFCPVVNQCLLLSNVQKHNLHMKLHPRRKTVLLKSGLMCDEIRNAGWFNVQCNKLGFISAALWYRPCHMFIHNTNKVGTICSIATKFEKVSTQCNLSFFFLKTRFLWRQDYFKSGLWKKSVLNKFPVRFMTGVMLFNGYQIQEVFK
jgi:hypothetical protein